MGLEKDIKKQIKEEMTQEELANRWKPTGTKTQGLTKEKLQSFLPKKSSAKLTDALMETISRVEEDTGMDQGLFEEQLCSYAHLIGPGISFEKLTNAIKFVTLRQVAGSSANAYRIVFPQKSDEVEARGQSVDSFASMYADTKAVIEVQKLNMLPVHITHRPLGNQLIKKFVDLSNGIGAKPDDYVSPTVQLNATIAAYEAIKPPEDNTMELKLGMTDSAMAHQQELIEVLKQNAQSAREAFMKGRSLNEVQQLNLKVIDGEVTE